MDFKTYFHVAPEADPACVVSGPHYRITVLTDRLVRLEYSPTDAFCDLATQTVINRRFETPAYKTYRDSSFLIVETDGLRVKYDEKPFSSTGLTVELKGNFFSYQSIWHFGEEVETYKGTARTLDMADGAIPLGEGLTSFKGYAALDDSASMRIDEDGSLLPPVDTETDIYVFGYGRDFYGCYRDFMRLAGKTPPLPRYALGNWWSRFYPYTEDSYKELMTRFEDEGVPLSVSVLDMNWHTTKIDPKYGAGWTGYTWDKECFPHPDQMLAWLHEHGLSVTLNDHPADGLRAYEDLYESMALEMGMDPKEGKAIPFDAANKKYADAFEKCVLDVFAETGVDFWWLDWQQEGGSSVPGIDPLFMLNHWHYLYALKSGKPAMTFSRYAGPGSHRYPIGFSGDSIVSWASLDFQPYFTAVAANIGYCWWSHDIGGHMLGICDEELATRWLQFGVFSPIMRLHSSPSDFVRKEPWSYSDRTCSIMKHFLRIRHKMLPWLYTQNLLSSENNTPFIRPVYYDAPTTFAAFYRKNEYLLGDGLIVLPITQPAEKDTGIAAVRAWLPNGRFTDAFNGRVYEGERTLNLYRALEDMPVLAKDGMILPMDGADVLKNGAPLTKRLVLKCFPGACGESVLLEDNGLMPGTDGYVRAATKFSMTRGDGLTVKVEPVDVDGIVPEERVTVLELYGMGNAAPDTASCAYETAYDADKRILTISLTCKPCEGAELTWNTFPAAPAYDILSAVKKLVRPMTMKPMVKDRIVRILTNRTDRVEALTELHVVNIPKEVYGAVAEILSVK